MEAETGFFMAVGSARKSLSLSLCPSNPEAVYPNWFDYWWQHDQQPPPPYRTGLSAGGPGGVGIYSGPTGGDPLTGGDLSWGWKEVAPYGEPYEFEEISTPTQRYVQAKAPGTCTVDLWLMFRCPEECGDWLTDGGDTSDHVKVTVLGVDLAIDGVPYTQEENPGGFVALGGLRPITLQVLPATLPGTDEATLTWTNDAKIDVYENQDRTNPINSGKTYALSALPKTLYVEADQASDQPRDIEMKLSYSKGGATAEDVVKLTVVEADLDIDGVADADEETVGGYVGLNDDDDDGDGVVDYDDGYDKDGIPGNADDANASEDDLVKVTVQKVLPQDLTGTVTLSKTDPGSRIKLWTSATKGAGNEVTLPAQYQTPSDLPKELYVEGVAPSASERDVELKVEYTKDGATCTDKVKVTVVQVDLDLDGLPDAEEQAVGGYMCPNHDDDDADGVTDTDDGYNKDGIPGNADDANASENDLVGLTLQQVVPTSLTGPVTLSKTDPGGRIKLWTSATKGAGNEVNLPAQYQTPADLPKILYVEAISLSDAERDVELKLSYTTEGKAFEDVVKLTVGLDLDMEGVAEDDEESPGGYISLNNDDDDDNHTEDKAETGPITGEDNLVKIIVRRVLPATAGRTVTLSKTDPGSRTKVWTSATKGTEVTLPVQYDAATDLPKELWVEGYNVSGGERDVELRLEHTEGNTTCSDTVKVTVVEVQSVAVDASDDKTHKIVSVLPANQVPDDHFVTAKGDENIVLVATISPDTEGTRSRITWTGMTQDPANKLKATRTRGASGKYPATVDVSGASARSLANWVVWSAAETPVGGENVNVMPGQTLTEIYLSGPRYFRFTLQPSQIIDDADRPNLSGVNGTHPPDVPSGETDVWHCGLSLSGGANAKWDESRQLRKKLFNLGGVDLSAPCYRCGCGCERLGWVSRESWPSNPAAGNDDRNTLYEDNNPYDASNHGQLTGRDDPCAFIRHADGTVGDTLELRLYFREFARLLLGTTWYRISDTDAGLWCFHIKVKKADEAIDGQDYNRDGDQTDQVWVDNGSFVANDNGGW